MAVDTPTDHNDAWSLAHMRAENSNLARCYIELREAARLVAADTEGNNWGIRKLRAICEAND